MRVLFVGVGEAFDETRGNTSIYLSGSERVLLDCGFTAAHDFWRLAPDPLELDAVSISHLHGDHYFGLPALLLGFAGQGRTRPLAVIGGPDTRKTVERAFGLAFGSLAEELSFELEFPVARPGEEIVVGRTVFSFAENGHSVPCLAVAVRQDGKKVFYSGDGRPTPASRALAGGADLVAHECYGLEEGAAGHGSLAGSLEFAREAGARALAAVHMNREVRRNHQKKIRSLLAEAPDVNAFLPESGDWREI